MPENKEMDSELKKLVDYLYSPKKAASNESGEKASFKLFKQVFPSIWVYLKLEDKPDLVMFEAFLINTIYHINEIKKSMTERQKRNAIKKCDNNLLAFGLLKGYYHTKIDEYKIESWYSVQERDEEYLVNSDYIILEHPNVANKPRNSQIWKQAKKSAKAALYTSDIRAREDVTVKMTEWMNEGTCQIHLQEGMNKFIDEKSGRINLPEPCYTLANFPLNKNLDIVKTDEQNQAKNGETPSPNNEVEEFDIKEDNPAKIILPVNELKGNNANRNSFDVEENKVPQQIEQEIKNNEKIDKDEICTEGEGVSDISSDEKSTSASPLNDDNINAEKEKPDAPSEESPENTTIEEGFEDSETNNSEPLPNSDNRLSKKFEKLHEFVGSTLKEFSHNSRLIFPQPRIGLPNKIIPITSIIAIMLVGLIVFYKYFLPQDEPMTNKISSSNESSEMNEKETDNEASEETSSSELITDVTDITDGILGGLNEQFDKGELEYHGTYLKRNPDGSKTVIDIEGKFTVSKIKEPDIQNDPVADETKE